VLRGFLGGLISGIVVSGLVLGVVSVLTEIPGRRAPEATAIEVPAGSEFDHSREDTEASLTKLQETPDPDAVPQVAAPEPDDLQPLDDADTDPAAQPETGDAEAALAAPDAQEESVGVTVDSDEPVLPNPQAMAPEAPAGEEELSISTEPAQPGQPEVDEDSAACPADEMAEIDESFVEAPDEPEMDPGETGSEDGETATDVDPDVAEDATQSGGDPVENGESEGAGEVPLPQEDPAAEDRAADAAPQVPEDPGASEETASGTIGDLAEGVTTNRLPTAIDDPETAVVAEPAPGVAEEGEEPVEDTRPPLERFAAEFENPEDKPLMAIVLIDDGTSPIGIAALREFPYPVSFALDTAWPGADEAAEMYRDQGYEVLAMIDLPEGASATDVEVSMQSLLGKVPGAVAVMEGSGTGLQSNRETAIQLAPILMESGHGLVMLPKGLNTTQKLLSRAGLPAASVFRDFDSRGQDATVIRRFLDQAAFRAGQEEEGVIMVGRLRPESISALLLWGLQDRASRVALAPVSALLTAGR